MSLDWSTINWTMVEALGTIFAVIIALFFGLRADFDRYINRPKIVLKHLDEEGYVEKSKDYCLLKLGVSNEGSISAINVRVRIESTAQNGLMKLDKTQLSNVPLLQIPSLQNTELIFFQLIKVRFGSELIEFPMCAGWQISRGNCQINLLVTGDNFKAYRKSFKFTDSTDPYEVRLTS